MTKAQNIIFRVLVIGIMTFMVLVLMRLTGASLAPGQPRYDGRSDAAPLREIMQTKEQRLFAMAENWSGDIIYGAPYSALTPLNSVENAAADERFDPADDYWGLPRSEGVETVAGYCSACHSLAIVMQQRQTEEGWDYLLDWMVEKQGMAVPPDDMREEILGYLSREFGS